MDPLPPVLSLLPVPALADNYIWLLHDGQDALAVDPGAAEPLRNALQALGLTLRAILVTHHHGDHWGGLADLEFSGPIYGPAASRVPHITHPVREGDRLTLLGQDIDVWEVPGHTLDHLAYVVRATPTILFCGDTLFSAGCGRLFEGTAQQLFASLQRLAHLPADTLTCPAHEYTLSNLRFALALEPQSEALTTRLHTATAAREAGQPTLPTTMGTERLTNPFLRCDEAPLVAAASRAPTAPSSVDPVAVFAALRLWKNQF